MIADTENAEAIIRITGLSTRFGPQVVHDGLDLAIGRGEIMGLVGGSGTGKSVLMRAIIGLIRPTAGRIEVFGRDVSKLNDAERRRMQQRWGVLFQDGALFSSLTVAQNIEVPLKEHSKVPPGLRRQLADMKISMVGLPPDAADKFPSELSGGMRKRAGLARALALDPEILFLDEPTAGLDPISANRINDMIRNAVDTLGATALSITSDMESARHRYDHLFMIHEGRMLWAGPNSDIDQADNPYLEQMINGRAEGPIKMRLHARA